jgi:hypothetical protein
MPGLVTLKTDLKSLKYGQDRPGGGGSGQPYIQNDINNPKNILGFDDGFIRGGAIGAAKHSISDTLRIGKFLTDAPQGPLFIAKQVGLQLSNPKLESKIIPNVGVGGFLGGVLNTGINILNKNQIGPTRIYNLGINTIAEIPVEAFGGHFNRHGLLPVQTDDTKYLNVVDFNNRNNQNRLVLLTSKFRLADNSGGALTATTIDDYIGGPDSAYGIGRTVIRRYDSTRIGNPRTDTKDKTNPYQIKPIIKISNYLGVSTSNKSVFAPDFYFYNNNNSIQTNKDIRLNLNNRNANFDGDDTKNNNHYISAKNSTDLKPHGPSSYPGLDTGSFAYALSLPNLVYNVGSVSEYSVIKSTNDDQNKNIALSSFGIYRDLIHQNKRTDSVRVGERLPSSTETPYYRNYLGDKYVINKSWNKATREIRVGSGRKDQINLTPLFDAPAGTHDDEVTGKQSSDNQPHGINDLVKFRIQAIDSDSDFTTTSGMAKWMIFRAYLTQFTDNVDASWNEVKYAGRGDKFFIYEGVNRKINIGFKVAALSAEEMKPMYQKLNYLMSNLMPDYDTNTLLMRGPLVRITVGNWIDGQLGKLDSLSYTIPQDSPWEIALGDKQLVLPHVIEVSLTFTPIGSQTRDKNRLQRKDDCISHIAQNWNAKNDPSGDYIVPCKEDDTIPEPIITPPPVPIPPPVPVPETTGGGGGGNKIPIVLDPFFLPKNQADSTSHRYSDNPAFIKPKRNAFKGFGEGSGGGAGSDLIY